jgi:uncharacterized protein YndB with AHSA1/START domain
MSRARVRPSRGRRAENLVDVRLGRRTGKTLGRTDTYHGRFVKLVPNELMVEIDEFETADPALRGEMTITISLSDADGGTELVAVHGPLPAGVSPADNEVGWQEALRKLATHVESTG